MSEAADGATPSRPAWQPFTFGGVAAFARGRVGYVLLAQLTVALLCGVICVGFFQRAYVPVVYEAIEEMPETAKIANGRLIGVNTSVIADNKHLAIAVTPETAGTIGQSADVQFQFRPSNFRVGSVFRPDWGLEFAYDPAITLDLSRSNLDPWWGAWRPVCLAAAGVSVLVVLFVNWAILALIYTAPAKFLAWFGDRDLTWMSAWQLASAALIPGALVMTLAILLYGSQAIDLIGLGFFFVTHFLVGWVYVGGGALACPRRTAISPLHNPFNT